MDKVRVGKPKKNKTTGEFKVPVYINGKYSEEDTYYTNDMSDAMSTMKSMIATYSKSKKYELVEASKEFEDDFGDEEKDDKKKKKKFDFEDDDDYKKLTGKKKKSKKEDEDSEDDEDDFDDEDDKPKKKKKKAKKSKKEDDEMDDFDDEDEPDTMKEEILRLSNIVE